MQEQPRNGSLQIWAFEDVPNPLLPGALEPGGSALLEALLYERTLAQLGLQEGPLNPAPVGQGELLPDASRLLSVQLSEKSDGAWRTPAELSEVMRSLRVSRAGNDCIDFEPEVVGLPEGSSVLTAQPLSDDSLLLITEVGAYTLSSALELRAVQTTIPESGEHVITSGMLRADGTLWLSTERDFYTAVLQDQELVATRFSAPPPSTEIIGMVEGPSNRQLTALTHAGEIFILDLDARSWRRLYRSPEFNPTVRAGMTRLEDGRIAVVRAFDPNVIFIETDGTLSQESPESTGFGFSSIRWIEGLGLVIGSTAGELSVRQADGTWRSLGPSGLTQEVQALAYFDGGLVSGGTDGNFSQFRIDLGFCEPQLDLTVSTIRHITPFAGGLLLTGRRVAGLPSTPVTLIRWEATD